MSSAVKGVIAIISVLYIYWIYYNSSNYFSLDTNAKVNVLLLCLLF